MTPKKRPVAIDYTACVRAKQASYNDEAKNVLGITIAISDSAQLYCAKDYVLVGTNYGSIGSSLCCKANTK